MRAVWLTIKALAGLALAVVCLLIALALFFLLRDPSIKPMLGWLALPFALFWVWLLWPEKESKGGERPQR